LDAFDEVKPLDIFESEYPSLWLGKSRKSGKPAVIGAFNFDETPKTLLVEPGKAGFAPGAKVKVKEFWSQENIGETAGSFQTELKPHSCKIFLLEI